MSTEPLIPALSRRGARSLTPPPRWRSLDLLGDSSPDDSSSPSDDALHKLRHSSSTEQATPVTDRADFTHRVADAWNAARVQSGSAASVSYRQAEDSPSRLLRGQSEDSQRLARAWSVSRDAARVHTSRLVLQRGVQQRAMMRWHVQAMRGSHQRTLDAASLHRNIRLRLAMQVSACLA